LGVWGTDRLGDEMRGFRIIFGLESGEGELYVSKL